MQPKTVRLETRLTPDQKKLMQHAAALEGKTLSDFVLSSAYEAAKRTVQENNILILSARDRETFVKALLDDSEPSPRLKKAAQRYKKIMGIR